MGGAVILLFPRVLVEDFGDTAPLKMGVGLYCGGVRNG